MKGRHAIRIGLCALESEVARLASACAILAKHVEKDAARRIEKDIHECFEAWKLEQADAKGEVETFYPLSFASLMRHPRGVARPASNVEPWHCAGLSVENEIDLAFKLWLDSYPPVDALLEKHGTCKLFAFCGLLASRQQDNARSH